MFSKNVFSTIELKIKRLVTDWIVLKAKYKTFLRKGVHSFLCGLSVLVVCKVSTLQAAESQLSRSIVESTLSNGLKVIIREDHRAPIAVVQLWYGVGSADEPGHLMGISHALEHMMFKGTTKVPDNEFTRLSRIYGGRVNAATASNYTYYYQLYPKAYLPLALELEADRMKNLRMRQQDFDTEIQVVMEERRQRIEDKPTALGFERFQWLTYPTSTYRQPVAGYMKNLQNLKLDQLKDWYKTWYTPNNATLVIIGDVDAEQTLKQVHTYFASITSSPLPARNDLLEFERVGYRHMESSLGVQVPNLYMAWNVKSLVTAKNPQDAYALSIIQSILNGGVSSRLQTELIRKKKILTSINVSYEPYNRGDSLFTITALPAPGISLRDAQYAIQEELDQLKTQPLDNNELQRVRSRFVSQLVFSQDDIAGQAHMIGNLEVNGLSFRLIDELPSHYESVQPQDIQRVANAYFVRDNLTTLYLQPASKDTQTD